MQIDVASPADCHDIAEVHVESWQHAYRGILRERYLASLSVPDRQAMWRRLVDREPSHLLVARRAGTVAGFIAFGASRDEGAPDDRAEVWAIYVRPGLWSTGVGRQLWLAAWQQMQTEGYTTVGLWVIADNARAIRFYERAGFVVEAGSDKPCEIGGTTVREIRYVFTPSIPKKPRAPE